MSRIYTPHEIDILKSQTYKSFSEAELEACAKGEQSLKLEYDANKAIQKYVRMMHEPISRNEAVQNFVTKGELARINNTVVTLVELLERKGIGSREDIDRLNQELAAKALPHLCNSCSNWEGDCKIKAVPVFAKDQFSMLEGELASKVIRCEQYMKPANQGIC